VIKLKRTIVLVGLMGAGKTSVGKRLAELLAVPFFDSDDEIASAASMTIPEIFDRFGEEEFRRGETAVLSRLVGNAPSVLSTGGGAFVSEANRMAIASGGVSVWLNVKLDVLWSRVQDKPGRPLLATENPYETLKELHKTREPIYQLADTQVTSTSRDTHDDVAKSIVKALAMFDRANPERAVFERSGKDG